MSSFNRPELSQCIIIISYSYIYIYIYIYIYTEVGFYIYIYIYMWVSVIVFLDEAAGHLGAVMYPKHDRMPHPRRGRPGGQSKRD